jgi:hypothetical protein
MPLWYKSLSHLKTEVLMFEGRCALKTEICDFVVEVMLAVPPAAKQWFNFYKPNENPSTTSSKYVTLTG